MKQAANKNESEQPLFSFLLTPDDFDEKGNPDETICGTFGRNGQRFEFHPKLPREITDPFIWEADPDDLEEPDMIMTGSTILEESGTWTVESAGDLEPLFDFLIDEKQDVTVTGKPIRTEHRYDVYTLAPTDKISPLPSFLDTRKQELAEFCISRLRKSARPYQRKQNAPKRLTLCSQEDFETYYRVCRHTLPGWVADAMKKELQYLENKSTSSTNKDHARSALRYLTSIDWDDTEFDLPDPDTARQRLNAVLYGMEEVKTRVLEIISAIQVRQKLPEWGLLLYGPPGVGKTAVSYAIAELLNRPTVMLSETGNSSVGGSERIYQNARPGFLVEKMAEAGTKNIVVILQELDKLGENHYESEYSSLSRNDLLSLADHQGFTDKYMEQKIPSDGIFIIATCNDLSKLSAPLRDRFQCILIPDYTISEKETILKHYIWPKAAKSHSLAESRFILRDEACRTLVREYAGDSGVRELERAAERLYDDFCRELLCNRAGESYCGCVTSAKLRKLLGPGNPMRRTPEEPGEVNAVLCMESAAQVLLLEASAIPGAGRFQVYGEATRLQRDYIYTAYECVRRVTPIDVEALDIAVFVRLPYADDTDNSIGCAAFAAICCAVKGVSPLKDTVFYGGVGLNGRLYSETSDFRPLARALARQQIRMLFGPIGTGEKLAQAGCDLDNLITLEAGDIYELMSLTVEFQKTA